MRDSCSKILATHQLTCCSPALTSFQQDGAGSTPLAACDLVQQTEMCCEQVFCKRMCVSQAAKIHWAGGISTSPQTSQQPLFCRVRAFQRLRLFQNCLFFWMNRLVVHQAFAVVNHHWAPKCSVGLAVCQGSSNPPVHNKRSPGTSNTPYPPVLCCPEHPTSPVSSSQNSHGKRRESRVCRASVP